MQKRFRHVDRSTIINAVRVRRYIDRSIRRFIDEEKADLLKTAQEIAASKDLFPENAQRAMSSLIDNINKDNFDAAINDCGVISSAADSNDLKQVVSMSAELAVKIVELDKIMKREKLEQKAAAGNQKAQTRLANVQNKEAEKQRKIEEKAAAKQRKIEEKAAEKQRKIEAKAAEKAAKAEAKAAAAAAKKQEALELKEYMRKQKESLKAIEKFKAQQAKEFAKAESNIAKAEKGVEDIDKAIEIAKSTLEGKDLEKQLKSLATKRQKALQKVDYHKKAYEVLKATRAREMRSMTGNERQIRRVPVGPGINHWNLGKAPKAEDRLPLALRRDMLLKKLDRMLKR